MNYSIYRIDESAPTLGAAVWDKAELGTIACEPWTGFSPAPPTEFRVLRYADGFSVLMHTQESNLRAEVINENGRVCDDSCMEFFMKPDPYDIQYLNFEFNPKGVLHLGLGKDRYGRLLLTDARDIFHIETRANEGDWTLKFDIPDAFLLRYFKQVSPVFRGNFYKCGDLTDHLHYATWSPVYAPKPDYHLADFFGLFTVK
ncbi:MAG: hypothetical protein E7618_02315 [Ruminococcaceae bacterium]|nr:hypothetical protein [Oscillospiraceae bacterium]